LLAIVGIASSCSSSEHAEEFVESQDAPLTSLAEPVKLVDLEGQGPLRLSATHVFFFDKKLGALRRVPKAGGFVETILRPKEGILRDFVVDAESSAVWVVHDTSTAHGALSARAGQVLRVPLDVVVETQTPVDPADRDAGTTTTTTTAASGPAEMKLDGDFAGARLAVDANDVYVAAEGKLSRFPKRDAFTQAEVIGDTAFNNVVGIAVDATHVYWADRGSALGGACVQNKGKVFARSKNVAVTTVRTLASGEDCPTALVLDGTTLFFRSGAGSSPIRRVSTTATFAAASNFSSASASNPAVDGNAVFYATVSGGGSGSSSQSSTLKSLTKTSFGTTRTFEKTKVSRGVAITSVVVDATHAYYTETDLAVGISRIQRVAK